MKTRFNTILLLCLMLCSAASAQRQKTDANITGHLIDAATGEHIPHVVVTVFGTTIGTSADASGHYALRNLPEGELVIEAHSMGYAAVRKTVVAEKGKTLEVNFSLSPSAVNIDQVVITASRNEALRKEAPTIVNVVSAEILESTSSANLAEGLNFQPGLRVEFDCSNCGVPQLRINGLEGPYSQILLDSRPVFSSLASVYGLEQFPASMIDRVEVIRGGGSALFGGNAIGGVVNIITREPVRNSLAISNNTTVMKGGKTDNMTSFNGSYVSDDSRAGVFLFGSIRNRSPYDRNDDGFSDLAKLKSEAVGFRGYYKTGLNSKLSYEYHHINEFRRGGNEFRRPPHEADIAEQLRHVIDGGGLSYEYFSSDYAHKFNIYTSAQNIKRESYFGTDKNLDAYGNTRDRVFITGAQYTYAFDNLLFMPAELTAGTEYNLNKLEDEILWIDRQLDEKYYTYGGYVQNEWKSKKVNFLIGARADKHNKIDDPVFSPRVNFRYTPSDAIAVRASYSSGYRAPQTYDEDLHVGAVGGEVTYIETDPNLKPEYSNSFSGSVDLYHNFGKVQANLLVEGFYTDLKDVFALADVGSDNFGNRVMFRHNASGAVVKGLNFESKFGLTPKLTMSGGYTLQSSRYKEPEEWSQNPDIAPQRKMFRSPDSYGFMLLNYEPVKNFATSLNVTYTGSMLAQHMAGYVPYDEEVKTPHFWDAGFRMAYTFNLPGSGNMELSAGMKNVFDSFQKDIDRGMDKDAGYIYGPALPRSFIFGVKFTL